MAILHGTDGNDFTDGSDAWDVIVAYGGNDYIESRFGQRLHLGGRWQRHHFVYQLQTGRLLPPQIVGRLRRPGERNRGVRGQGDTIGTFISKTDTFYCIENITGSNYDDHLYGDGGSNWLYGWDGDDYLDGRNGTSTFSWAWMMMCSLAAAEQTSSTAVRTPTLPITARHL